MGGADQAQLFNDLPPENASLLERLLVDREVELKQARTQLLAVRDADLRRPVAIIGSARVGKSYVLRHLGCQVAAAGEFSVVIPLYLTSGLRSSRAVLREMWTQYYAALHNAVLERGIGPAPERMALEPLEAMLNVYSPAVAGEVTRVQVKRGAAVTRGISSTIGSKLPSFFARLNPLEASFGTTRQEQHSEELTVEVAPFDESALTDLIALAHAMVRENHPDWTTLLVLDDVDLLPRGPDGAFDPDDLVQALGTLARVEGLHIVSTLRRDTYARHNKVFHLGTEIAPFVDDGYLLNVHRRHVEILGSDETAFALAFVTELARRSAGRVGVFLAHLRRAWLRAPGSTSVATFVGERFAELEREEPELCRLIRNSATVDGRLAGSGLARLRNSAAFIYVIEDTTSENAARVDSVLSSVLRDAEVRR